ncbi:membrane protein insertion efficiency factor YidD [Burkholderia vietnamiensis]|uniref:membrane protein insertion efficiency factor YidD n=1 Tax=Burkholderia vietnamiensis TaxID=60552 RepID=UPI001E4F3240|nr:membrane protein insertion efficiency factor YidD [Burkholderia vietnamiensis]MDN8115619.1 membrane protein insertion efficiency factor YidD [Burkholderia vietnamiensis]
MGLSYRKSISAGPFRFNLSVRRYAPVRLRDACVYEPSCSEYALQAIRKHGTVRGWSMVLKRIIPLQEGQWWNRRAMKLLGNEVAFCRV